MIFDVTAAAGLTLALLLVVGLATTQLAAAQRDSAARRQLRILAEDELNRMRAGLVSIPAPGDTRVTRLESAVLETTAVSGSGEWEGFASVHVSATQKVQGQAVRVMLAGYVARVEAKP